MGCAHLVPHCIVFTLLCIVFVEVDHVDGGLGVLLLLLLRDAVAGKHALPFLGQTLVLLAREDESRAQRRGKGSDRHGGQHISEQGRRIACEGYVP